MNIYVYRTANTGGIASPNANQFWGRCESLLQSE